MCALWLCHLPPVINPYISSACFQNSYIHTLYIHTHEHRRTHKAFSFLILSDLNKMVLKFLIFLATILGLLTSITESVRFDLETGTTKCISEDIKSNSMTVGKYTIVNPNEPHHYYPSSGEQTHQPLPDSHKLTVRVIFHFLPSFDLPFLGFLVLWFLVCYFLQDWMFIWIMCFC